MGVEITNLDLLTTAEIQQAETFVRDLVGEYQSNLDTSPGTVLDALVVKLHGILAALNRDENARQRQTNSLNSIIASPDTAEDDTVDKILSNYLITRQGGTVASGQVTIVLDSLVTTPIPTSITFSAGGVTYVPTQNFSGVTSSDSVLTTAQKLISQRNDGTYSFVINVVSTATGTAGNIEKGTILSTSSTLAGFVQAVAANDFTGGSDSESNQYLVNKLLDGVSSKNMGSKSTIKAMIQSAFPGTKDVSVVGAGLAEMHRDKANTLGLSTFGKADIYVRPQTLPVTEVTTVSASLSDKSNGLWEYTFNRDTYPGLYTVEQVTRVGSDITLPITAINKSTDATAVAGIDYTPEMSGADSAFSRYQVTNLQFEDFTSLTDLSNGDKRSYEVTVTYMPSLASVSDYALSSDRRHPGGDYLVKAAVPCSVAIGINIILGPGEATPDTEAMKVDIAKAVNNIDFVLGKLSVDRVISAVTPYLGMRSRIKSPVDMRGRITIPQETAVPGDVDTDQYEWIFDNYELAIPYRPDLMITARTTMFYITANNIDIKISNSDHLS